MPPPLPSGRSRPSRLSLAGLVALVLAVSSANQWWVERSQRTLGAQVSALAQPGDIRMLSSDSCGICAAARIWFVEHKVPFSDCSIERDAGCRRDFDALRAAGTPVLLVRGKPQLGFSPARLRQALSLES